MIAYNSLFTSLAYMLKCITNISLKNNIFQRLRSSVVFETVSIATLK